MPVFRALTALDGLFGLSFFWHTTKLTPDAFATLVDLPRLGFLGCNGLLCNDEAIRHIAAIPRLRMLMAQGTIATDEGFEALATLPSFPALRELMPMDVSDHGFRHVGRCENLERLTCMYCRDTTDAATTHIQGLRKLKTCYVGRTKIM